MTNGLVFVGVLTVNAVVQSRYCLTAQFWNVAVYDVDLHSIHTVRSYPAEISLFNVTSELLTVITVLERADSQEAFIS